jgi:ATP-binding cassette subfamily F protein 3
MDEPTNHLDIQSKNVLKEALLRFQGTLILVSHDRDFTQGLCQKVVAFRDGGVQLFLGDINAYLEHLKLDSLKELERQKKNTKADKKESNNEYLQHKIDRQETQKIEKIERKISQLEKEIKEIDFELEINYEETISQPDFFDHYNAKKKKLEVLMQEWEALHREL